MANARDTRMVMIVDSEPAQQRFLSALVSRGGWRSIVAADTRWIRPAIFGPPSRPTTTGAQLESA